MVKGRAMIYKSLIHQLEHVVLAMEQKGETSEDIHSSVEMILRGFVRDGELTKEYLKLAAQAKEFKEQLAREEAMRNTSPIVSVNGSHFSTAPKK